MLLTRAGIIAAGATTAPLVRTHLNHGTAAATTVVVSITPTANALLIASTFSRRNGNATVVHTCVDNGGNTWTKIAEGTLFNTNGVRVTKWQTTVGASPGTFNVTAGTASTTNVSASIEQFTGASSDLSNFSPMATSGSGAPTATLPNTPSATSFVLASYGCISPTLVTAASGYTEIIQLAPAGMRAQTSYNQTTTAAATWSGGTASESVLGLLEIKKA